MQYYQTNVIKYTKMTPTEELRLKCLQLASSHLSCEPHDIETLLGCAQRSYDFVTEQPADATDDPQAPYEVSYIAEKPTGAVSREWLYDELTEMLDDARCAVDRNPKSTGNYYIYRGQCAALRAVINLINPKKDA